MSDCIGCGYCCTKAPCPTSIKLLGANIIKCSFLYWENGRHWCSLITNTEKKVSNRYRMDLAIGAGCSSSMFNTFRKELKDRTNIEYERGEF